MNKAPVVALAVGAVLSIALLGAGPAAATSSTSETIVLKRDANLNPIGWNAYGPTFVDSGSWASSFAAFGGGPSPIFAGTIKTIETGSGRTFELDFQVLANATGFGGHCQLTDGTGGY